MAGGKWNVQKPSAYLEKDEVWAIIRSVPLVSKHIERDNLLLWTMWETGGRVTEVLTLIASQIDQKDRTINLVNLKQKIQKTIEKILPGKLSQSELLKLPRKTTSVSPQLTEALVAYCLKYDLKDDSYSKHILSHDGIECTGILIK